MGFLFSKPHDIFLSNECKQLRMMQSFKNQSDFSLQNKAVSHVVYITNISLFLCSSFITSFSSDMTINSG